MGNYIYYGYTSVRRTVTLEPTVKKVDTATSVKEVSRPDCEITTLEKVIAITAPVVKEELKTAEEPKKVEEIKEEKVENTVVIKEEVKEVEVKEEVIEEKKEVKEEEKKEVKEEVIEEKEVEVEKVEEKEEVIEEKKEVKVEIKEKIVIEWKSATKVKEKSPLLTPIKEESMDVHPYLLEYGTNPIKSNTVLIQNQTYQVNKKKNKKKD